MLFQFQLGTIGTCEIEKAISQYHISIPVRYDWNLMHCTLMSLSDEISIPVRYDWNGETQIDVKQFFLFQFQLGTIGTKCKRERVGSSR